MRSVGTLLAACVFVTGGTALAHQMQHKRIKGEAIYYSDQFSGDNMACGSKYRPWKMVAAHRKLPCGTRLRVTNKANGEVVVVTVQDRGPYGGPDTILDVSRKAARKLDFISAGRTHVKAVVLHD